AQERGERELLVARGEGAIEGLAVGLEPGDRQRALRGGGGKREAGLHVGGEARGCAAERLNGIAGEERGGRGKGGWGIWNGGQGREDGAPRGRDSFGVGLEQLPQLVRVTLVCA